MNELINRENLIKKLAQGCDIPKDKAKKCLEVLEDIVIRAIALEDKVKFSFGVIGGKAKKPRKVVIPNGEIVHVPEKHGQPYYKPSKLAKE